MGTIVAFLLTITAVVSTVLIVWSPFDRLTKQLEGKKSSDFEKKIDEAKSEDVVAAILKYGCGYGCVFVIALLLGWVFEPIFVFGGLVNHMGNALFGYIALAVILINWFRSGWSLFSAKNKPKSPEQIAWEVTEKALEKTQPGYKAKPYKSDEPIKVNWFEIYFWKVVCAIPTAYLWYLLAIMVGLVANG